MRYVRIIGERTRHPLRVLLLLGNWIGGGAERVAVHLMKRLPERYDVHLGLLHSTGAYFDELDLSRVHVAPGAMRFHYDRPNAELFDARTLLSGAVNAPHALRQIIADVRPDVVMSFLKGTAILTWLALVGMRDRPRWIAREGNNVLAVAAHETPDALVRAASLALTRRAFRRADAVLANAVAMAEDLPRDLGIDPARTYVINNPVDLDEISRAARQAPTAVPDRPYLLSAGRLEYQKAHDVLLEGYARSGAAASHDLVILGEGSREAELRRLAAALGVAPQVHFIGFAANPYAWMARADLFVMPSRWEGFPNAAAEAMAAGAPLLLTDCSYGPRDIVAPGLTGSLVPVDDAPALGAEIARLLASPETRSSYSAAGKLRARRFAVDRMVARYADLIELVAGTSTVPVPELSFAPA